MPLEAAWQDDFNTSSHLRALLQHESVADFIRWAVANHFQGNVESFQRLRYNVWPHRSFTELPWIALSGMCSRLPYSFRKPHAFELFYFLCNEIDIEHLPRFQYGLLVRRLCLLFVEEPCTEGEDTARRWHDTICTTLSRLRRCCIWDHWLELRDILTHLVGVNTGYRRKWSRMPSVASTRPPCDKAIETWLRMMKSCGLDLEQFGQRTKYELSADEQLRNLDIGHAFIGDVHQNQVMEIRLIDVEYGEQASDWKLWWSEPTDGLAGEFWEQIEPEPLHIPGAWVQDI